MTREHRPMVDAVTAARMDQEYRLKAQRNKTRGLAAYETGVYNPFSGHDTEQLKKRFKLVLTLDDPSQHRVRTRIIDPVRAIAQSHGISAIYAGDEDVPPHITLQRMDMNTVPPERQAEIQNYLDSDRSHLRLLEEILKGHIVHLNDIVMAGATFYASTAGFSEDNFPLYRARRVMQRVSRMSLFQSGDQGELEPLKDDDITHITVGRLIRRSSSANLVAFANEVYETVGVDILANPVGVTIVGAEIGNDFEYFDQHNPKMLKGKFTDS
jgi:hypothetical protein